MRFRVTSWDPRGTSLLVMLERPHEWVHFGFCLFANAPIPPFWSFYMRVKVRITESSQRGGFESGSVRRGTAYGRKELVEEATLKVEAVREAHLVRCSVEVS